MPGHRGLRFHIGQVFKGCSEEDRHNVVKQALCQRSREERTALSRWPYERLTRAEAVEITRNGRALRRAWAARRSRTARVNRVVARPVTTNYLGSAGLGIDLDFSRWRLWLSLAASCDCPGWDAAHDLIEQVPEALREWLELPNGVPSADPLRRVITALAPAPFRDAFTAWPRPVALRSTKQCRARSSTEPCCGNPDDGAPCPCLSARRIAGAGNEQRRARTTRTVTHETHDALLGGGAVFYNGRIASRWHRGGIHITPAVYRLIVGIDRVVAYLLLACLKVVASGLGKLAKAIPASLLRQRIVERRQHRRCVAADSLAARNRTITHVRLRSLQNET
ncbi:MAG TPA: transposase family protein [Sorangium sp.]|nr:transposase family protein [Sorangium sp.]